MRRGGNSDSTIAALVDQLLAAEKTLQGYPAWQDGHPTDFRIRWPLLVGDSISTAYLALTSSRSTPEVRFSIALIYQACIARVDYLPDYEWHDNPLDRASLLGGSRMFGPHVHAWQDNRHLATAATLPKALDCARALPPQMRKWDQAFRWFCKEVNITLGHDQMIDLPSRKALL